MNARDIDPDFAAFMDGLRAAFGASGINASVKKGMAGLPGHFHYKGTAGEYGTKALPARNEISVADMQLVPFNPANKEPHADRNHRR
jgi:hypothetical protein